MCQVLRKVLHLYWFNMVLKTNFHEFHDMFQNDTLEGLDEYERNKPSITGQIIEGTQFKVNFGFMKYVSNWEYPVSWQHWSFKTFCKHERPHLWFIYIYFPAHKELNNSCKIGLTWIILVGTQQDDTFTLSAVCCVQCKYSYSLDETVIILHKKDFLDCWIST